MRVTGELQPAPLDSQTKDDTPSAVSPQTPAQSAFGAHEQREAPPIKRKRFRNSSVRSSSKGEQGAPLSELHMLEKGKRELEEKLARIERQIYDMETSYLEDTWIHGNVARGWETLMRKGSRLRDGADASARGSAASHPRTRKILDNDRIFSRSSATSPVGRAHGVRHPNAVGPAGDGLSRDNRRGVPSRQKKRRPTVLGVPSIRIPSNIAENSPASS
jgi:chromatin modification-related protein EAF6